MSQPYRFPPPPPTVNTLTPEQRTQLRRSSNKLTQVLGLPPHLVETYAVPARTSSPSSDSSRGRSDLVSKSQTKVHKRRRTRGEIYDPDSYPLSSVVPPLPPLSRSSSSSSSSNSHSSTYTADSGYHSSSDRERAFDIVDKRSRRPPLMVSTEKPLPPVVSSPPQTPVVPSSAHSSLSYATHSSVSHRSNSPLLVPPVIRSRSPSPVRTLDTIEASPNPTPRSSMLSVAPSFVLPSPLAARRAKMARVTKRLGEGVPVSLVFPDWEDFQDDDEKWSEVDGFESRCEVRTIFVHEPSHA
ncbi:hypothetical protein BD410DRAFT_837315 [Rickenella mellea]|uniref:Uncharacterized protein n=1 Tax=Rickenella mellea TaxID=50990 RepID=A0A4Y7QF83_9AGAM|nr:hypothetical protein BD410DRAFT_837315 [Rickenella mellea]